MEKRRTVACRLFTTTTTRHVETTATHIVAGRYPCRRKRCVQYVESLLHLFVQNINKYSCFTDRNQNYARFNPDTGTILRYFYYSSNLFYSNMHRTST